MAIPVLESFEGFTKNSSFGYNFTKPSGVEIGDFLLIMVVYKIINQLSVIPGFIRHAEYKHTSADIFIALFYRVADGTEADTFNIAADTGSDRSVGFYMRISGVGTDAPFNGVGNRISAASASSFTIENNDTTVNSCLAFMVMGATTGQLIKVPIAGAPWIGQLNSPTPSQLKQSGTTTFDAMIAFDSKDQIVQGAPEDAPITFVAATTDDFLGFQFALNPPGVTATNFGNFVLSDGKIRKAVTEISGLEDLEGETLGIGGLGVVADGASQVALCSTINTNSITNGKLTLCSLASRVHIGWRYISDIETLDVEASQGTLQGKTQRVPKVTIRYKKSRLPLVGPNQFKLQRQKPREDEDMGSPTALLTGDRPLIIEPEWNSNGRIFIRMLEPEPLTVTAIIPELEIEDDE